MLSDGTEKLRIKRFINVSVVFIVLLVNHDQGARTMPDANY